MGRRSNREENEKMLKFLAEESKKAEKPLNVKQLSREFIEKSGSSRNLESVRKQVCLLLLKVPKMDNIDKEAKVRMLFALSGQVNEEYLNELLNDAVVVVDQKQRITKYVANDGNLKLEGNHNAGAKIKSGWESSKRRSQNPRDFQEEENVEEENVQVMTNIRRLSKKPSLYDNSSSNDTSEEQMDFDGHDMPAQLQNEPVKVQNFGTSLKRDTMKRKVNTQKPKSTKKSKKSSPEEGLEPEEDVVYEGPGEPPRPVQLPRKREPVEELFEEPIVITDDEQQKQEMKSETLEFFENLGNLKLEENVDFGVSPEDAVDSFSPAHSESSSMIVSQPSSDSIKITKFLKPLRSLVETLESPKLCDLREKIDSKIKELGDKNLKAPIKYILFSLQSVILFVTKHAKSSYLEEDSTSLKEFLLIFRAAAFDFTAPEFSDFQNTLREAINQIGKEDKRIPYEKIQYGLEYAIQLVLP